MFNRWLYRFYNVLLLALLPLIVLWIAIRWRKRFFSRGLERWDERWGNLTEAQKRSFAAPGAPWWWVHAVSLGEIKAIESFLKMTPEHARVRVVLSAVTPEAIAYAVQNHVADEIIAAPIDLPWIVRRAFRVIRPKLFVSVESEFWPNLLREARRSGASVALINGRLSERSFRSYHRIRRIMQALWDSFDLWIVRQEQDAARFEQLGVPADRLAVSGNLKYDLSLPPRRARETASSEDLVVVFGSTREGEEVQLLPVIETLRREWPRLKVIWAPRHIERVLEVESLLQAQGGTASRKTQLHAAGVAVDVLNVVWDSMGDLIDAYSQADIAVVGGSFVPKGGQNPIEPAALEVPVVFGPSMDNFYGIAERLVRAGGARQVGLNALAGCLAELLRDAAARRTMGQKARRVVEESQGATERTLEHLEKLCGAHA